MCLTIDSKLEIYRHDEVFFEIVKTPKRRMHSIQTGNSAFDDKFVIKGNEEALVLNLLNF